MFLLLVIIAASTSCSKNDTTSPSAVQSANTTLPAKAVTYVSANYPDASIDYYVTITNGAADYLVTLNTTEELAFNKSGDFLGRGENFHGGKRGDSVQCMGNGGGHHGGIPLDSLPTTLKDYVTANYAGFTIRHAEYDSLCINGQAIEVMLFKAGSEPVKLYFEISGNFLMLSERVLYSDVPAVVKDYITANYTGYTAADRAEKFTLADNSIQYNAYLGNGAIRKSVRMDAGGTFMCEKTGSVAGGHGGPGGGGCPGPGGIGGHHGGIPVDSLPAAIKTYITTNFAGYILRHAEYDSICPNGLVYEVDIVKVTSAPITLYFEMTTAFLMRSDMISYADLPDVVKSGAITNYPGYFAMKSEKLTLGDGTIQYLVDLTKPHTIKTVRFDANGIVVCER